MFSPLHVIIAAALVAPVLAAPMACADVMVIFAHGTTEPGLTGTLVGPPLQTALLASLGGKSLSFAGVNYPADIAGFLAGGSPQGSAQMAQDLTAAANACPNAALVTSGYSQGGRLVHNSANLLSASVRSRIKAAVIFGDPDFSVPVTGVSVSNTLVVCHIGDNICEHGDAILPPHLTYGADTPAAAAFIAAHV